VKTGAGTTASRLGHADLAIATLTDMRDQADMIANLNSTVPLIADMDTGYGGPVMVARAVEQYIRAGVAGFHIEDQVITKRCGHLSGKQVVTQEEFIARIRAAVAMRRRLHSDIVVIARTDALQSLGYENAINRLQAARDAGADVGFLEGMTSKEMARKVCRELAPWPMLLNMVEHGATPSMSRDEARELGFKVMIWSFATLAPAYRAIRAAMQHMKQTGTSADPPEMTPRKIFEVCGLEASMKIDEEAGGHAYAKL
jgi:methylisocitrate lyase